ncbi:hypothetical protein P389DRAFT_172165 [Cystobasidium minutum MCA 4210]|uniref:uncharacterized protein n=1 Tax=Cystobasidium minutum MCA 4210 TaxID=1397322 RepID=UPI0034CE4CDC|eukprot:jgi/Rhomi1/172165/fgenesh1_kg.4_\
MASGGIRPRLPDLEDLDDFENVDDSFVPAAKVSRKAPPAVSAGLKSKATSVQDSDAKKPVHRAEEGDRFELDLDTPAVRAPLATPSSSSVLKDIKENKRSQGNLPFQPLQSSGFPVAQRRPPTTSKPKESRFKASLRQKAEANGEPSTLQAVPQKLQVKGPSKTRQEPIDSLHAEIAAENNQKLEEMSEQEILEAQQELMAMLGGDMINFLKSRNVKVPEAYEQLEEVDTANGPSVAVAGPSEDEGVSDARRQLARSVRFSDNVSYSNPPSKSPSPEPVRKAIPLPAPGSSEPDTSAPTVLDEDDPESIRQKYFPQEPLNTSLDWMRDTSEQATPDSSDQADIRFDLEGYSHTTGPEYHSSDSHRHAGSGDKLSLSELLALTKSAVMGQRVLAFQILLKAFTLHASAGERASEVLVTSDNVTAIIGSCARGLVDKSVGVMAAAMALIEQYATLGRTRLNTAAAILTVKPAPLETFSYLLSTNYELPHLSALACLHILVSLLDTREDFVSTEIVEAPHLLENIGHTFLQVPWPPGPKSVLPEPEACQLFSIIISISRANAEALITRRIEQSALRFIAVHPWNLEGTELQDRGYKLSSKAMDVFTAYARYGMGCSAFSNSASLFREIQDFIDEKPFENIDFTRSWLDLVEAWSFCAIDPHSTIPEHDILWAETKDWGNHLFDLLLAVGRKGDADLALSRRLIAALSAWLEGSSKHDKPAYADMINKLNGEGKTAIQDMVKSAAQEPVTEEKAKTLLAIKSFVGLAQMDLGDAGTILSRIEIESVAEEPRSTGPEADDEGWIH